MNNNKAVGALLIFLSILLIVGYFFSSTKIKNLEEENKALNKKIEKIDLLNTIGTEKNETSKTQSETNQTPDSAADVNKEVLEDLKNFNESFITHLNNNEDVAKNNEELKSMTNEEAQNYLKENKYIYESNVSTESAEKDDHDHKEAFDIQKVTIETTDIKNYFDVQDDLSVTGLTTYKVNSTVNGDTTIGNFIVKADYVNENGKWKVNKVYSISPVSDQKAEEIFK